MRIVDDALRHRAADTRQLDLELDRHPECPTFDWTDRHARGDRRVAGVHAKSPPDNSHGALEAGRVSDREQLLRIGTATGTSHFDWDAEIDIDHPIR